MRFVDRSTVAPPASLEGPHSAGQRELARARNNFGLANPKPFKFRAYKSPDVLEKLAELFGRKCAYCESVISATSPTEVEHYRPKGGVEGASAHPGYWWLGAVWKNLLPSCIDCNRRRKHRIAASGMMLADLIAAARSVKCGKHKAFPVAGTTRAQLETDDLSLEKPLLINPCESNPDHHLTWLLDEDLSIVAGTDQEGSTTVHLFGLNRQGLVEERTKLLLRLKVSCGDIVELLDAAVQLDGSSRSILIGQAMRRLQELRGGEDDPYFALREKVWERCRVDLFNRYSTLLTNEQLIVMNPKKGVRFI